MGGNTINLQSSSYRIFVSFSTSDRDLAEHLAIGLRRNLDDFESVYCFTKPGRYNSKGGSRPSDNFIELIDESLRNCNIFLLLWSIHARSSKGVIYELNQAKHFAYMQNTKRLGKEFKILPICIDKCGLPQGLKSIVRVNYSTGENPQITLNQVLDFLDCPPENDHPSVIVVKQAIFELRTAFRSEDWQRVVQQYPNIFDHYHAAISANTHYMYAIALIKQERIAESLTKMQEGLALVHQKGDAELLYIYAQCLKERWRWNEVRFLAEKTISHFPNDARWQKLLLEAFSNSTISHSPYPQNQPSSQFNGFTTAHPLYQNQLPPQFNQVTGTFQTPQSSSFSNIGQVGSSGINGTTHTLNGNQTHSSSPLQQAPLASTMIVY